MTRARGQLMLGTVACGTVATFTTGASAGGGVAELLPLTDEGELPGVQATANRLKLKRRRIRRFMRLSVGEIQQDSSADSGKWLKQVVDS